MKKYLLVVLCCFPPLLFSQNQVAVDSLEHAFSETKNDSVKAEILSNLFREYLRYDIDKAKSINDQQFDLAQKSGNNYAYLRANYIKAFYYYSVSKPDSALVSLENALVYAEKSDNGVMQMEIHTRLGSIYTMLGKKDLGLAHIDKAMAVSKKYNDMEGYAATLIEKAYYFFNEKKLDLALHNYLIADSLLRKQSLKKNGQNLISALTSISLIYMEFKEFDKAEVYVLRAKELAGEMGLLGSQMTAERNLGMIDLYRKDYPEAEEKLKKVLTYYTSTKNTFREAEVLSLLGQVNMEQDKHGLAKDYYTKSLELKKAIPDSLGMLDPLQNLGKLNLMDGNYPESKRLYTSALDISRKMADLKSEVNALGQLAQVNFLAHDYKTASEYYQKYIPLKDSLTNSMNYQKVVELETKYETTKKEQQIESLSAQNQLAEQKRKSQLTLFAAILGLLCIAGMALAFAYRNKMKTTRKVRELNAMKSRFFANISHEFRTPLTLIKSPLQSLQSDLLEEKQQKQLSLIGKSANRMLELVDQLLELSKIDSGGVRLILKEGNIGLFLKSVIEPFEYQAKEKGVQFSSSIVNPSENCSYDKDVVEKIIANLLSNALKYTPVGNKVGFVSEIENENLKFRVFNSGSGLKKSDLPKLFERFYQKDEDRQGFGIGLALIKELVDLYDGKIETSLDDGILSFKVELPLSMNESKNIVVPKESLAVAEIQNIKPEPDNELPVLLIVDDKAEIRNLLKDIFSENYVVLEAGNGKKALKIAQKEIPDCIVSDVMMPEMDGFEFTKSIKNNELTSFIPVILLTAKTSEKAHLEGLKSTADAFLTKPFNNEILKETVLHQIVERRKLRECYSRELVLKPVDVVLNPVDEKFLEKLGDLMEKQLSNTGFSTDDFASEMGMSRMQLHRKLKTLLNVSATEFVRNERLKAAAELMKKGNKNVSEIAYAVGFNEVSYFSKCFKELFGETPSGFISNI